MRKELEISIFVGRLFDLKSLTEQDVREIADRLLDLDPKAESVMLVHGKESLALMGRFGAVQDERADDIKMLEDRLKVFNEAMLAGLIRRDPSQAEELKAWGLEVPSPEELES